MLFYFLYFREFTGKFSLLGSLCAEYRYVQLNIRGCHSDGCDTRIRQVYVQGYRWVLSCCHGNGIVAIDTRGRRSRRWWTVWWYFIWIWYRQWWLPPYQWHLYWEIIYWGTPSEEREREGVERESEEFYCFFGEDNQWCANAQYILFIHYLYLVLL